MVEREKLIEKMAREMCDDEFVPGTWDDVPVLRLRCLHRAMTALSAIEAEAVIVPREALEWLNGESEEFERLEGMKGAFWWRTEFFRRAGLIAASPYRRTE